MADPHQDPSEREDVSEIRNDIKEILHQRKDVRSDLIRERKETVGIPMILLIVAVVSALLGLSAWSLGIEQRKVERSELQEFKSDTRADLTEIKRDVKSLIYMHMKAKGTE